MKAITFELRFSFLDTRLQFDLLFHETERDYVTRLVFLESRLALRKRQFLIHCLSRSGFARRKKKKCGRGLEIDGRQREIRGEDLKCGRVFVISNWQLTFYGGV